MRKKEADRTAAAADIGMKLDPPWTEEEIAAINSVFDNPNYGMRRSEQILDAITPFVLARMDAVRRESPWRRMDLGGSRQGVGASMLSTKDSAWESPNYGPITPRNRRCGMESPSNAIKHSRRPVWLRCSRLMRNFAAPNVVTADYLPNEFGDQTKTPAEVAQRGK
jgi:hypothetical protein